MIGIIKNKIPPHADNPSDKKNPAEINFIKEIFPLFNFIPETKRYIAINAINRIPELRIFARSLLNFITNPESNMKIVGKRIANPAYPIMNVEVLSNIKENNINDIEKTGAAHIMKLSLFLMNGNEK